MKSSSLKDFGHGDQYGKLKHFHPDLVDFSSSINPLTISLSSTFNSHTVNHYPSIEEGAEKIISDELGIPQSHIVIFAGMTPLIHSIFDIENIKDVLLIEPLFSEYRKASWIRNCNITRLSLDVVRKNPQLLVDFRFDIVCINNPVNPTGEYISRRTIFKIAEIAQSKGAFLFLDEAYIDFLPDKIRYDTTELVEMYPRVILGRTFTKITGLPGIRLGFAIASKTVASKIRELRPPWTIPEDAIQFLLSVLHAKPDASLPDQIVYLKKKLMELGFTLIGDSSVNMLSFDMGEQLDPDIFYNKLIEKGFLIRPLGNFYGFNNRSFRISVRRTMENEALVKAMGEIING